MRNAMMNGEVKLYRNKKKTNKLLLYALTVCIVLVAVLLYSTGLFDGEMKLKPAIFSGAALLIMLILTLKTLVNLRDKSPLIEMNEQMFMGKTTPLSKAFGRVDWVDVKDVQLQKMGGDTLVVVTVGNADKYAGRLSKMMWNMAYDKSTGALQLMYSAAEVDVDAKALFELFADFWNTTGKKHQL